MVKITRILLLIAVCFLANNPIEAQTSSPYYLSLKRELGIGGTGIIATVSGEYLRSNVKPIIFGDLEEPKLLDIDDLNFFKQTLDSSEKPSIASNLSDISLLLSASLPTLFLTTKKTCQDFGTIGLLYLETMLINKGLTDIAKFTVLRPRPYVWSEDFSSDQIINSNDRASFFSGHTSNTAAASFFFARVFSDYFPKSRLKPYVWGVAATLPALTGYLRIRARKHYPTDVITGYIVGGFIGYIVPTLHKRPINQQKLKVSSNLNGFSLNLDF